MSGSVVSNTIKINNYFASICFENIQNEFLGLINIEINASYETLC